MIKLRICFNSSVQIRTPISKRTIFDTVPTTKQEMQDQTNKSRIGENESETHMTQPLLWSCVRSMQQCYFIVGCGGIVAVFLMRHNF